MDNSEIIYPQLIMRNISTDTHGNSVISPESCYSLFSATLNGFDEETKRLLLRVFFQQSETHAKSLNLFNKKLWKKTKLFTRNDVPLLKDFKDSLQNKFGCDVDEIDTENSDSTSMIKRWLQENISELSCDTFETPNMNNILKMNFEWDGNVKVETSRKKFHTNNNDIFDTDFIDLSGNFGYAEAIDLNAKLIEIPLSSQNLTYVIVVPNNSEDLAHLENRLSIPSLQYQVLSKMKNYQMNVSMPKIKLQQEHNLKDLFGSNLFMNSPFKFGTDAYRLGAMKTFASMEVTEKGIKGAALTACQFFSNPIVKEMLYETNISNRFANTLITSNVANLESISQETTFTVILPEDAFITEFVMEIKGKSYRSYIKEKEEAKNIYDQAVAGGRSAGHVAVSARDSNKFTVSVNIEPKTEMKFLLTYEELLQRRFDQYELVLNIQPGQLVRVLKVLTKINESKPLKFVKTPAMRSGNEITFTEGVNTFTKIEKSSTTIVKFEPTLENQREISRMLGTSDGKGISGQFVVQYDVELDPSNGEVLINDGYFVHFYAPDDLPPLDKHVVFALDTSGSMGGRKITQLKDAMKCILDQIKTNDLVDILDFTTHVTFHDIHTGSQISINYEHEENFREPFYKYERYNFPEAKPANPEIIEKAKLVVDRLQATSSTNIIGALETGLYLVKLRQNNHLNYQPMVIFLTDGQPNVGISSTDVITNVVTQLNHTNQKVPIFALSFGEDADKKFLRKISLDNYGFSRHIYEASDASLQLQQFYKQISSPLLSEVKFQYNPDVTQVTRTQFPIYFRGGHIVICGRHVDPQVLSVVNMYRRGGCEKLSVTVEKSTTQIERLWAYLTVKQLLEQRERVEDKTELTKKALELALKYSFVTEVTSLVVVKPEDCSVVDTENASIASSFQQNAGFGVQCMSQSMQTQSAGGYSMPGLFGMAAPSSAPTFFANSFARVAPSPNTSTGCLFGAIAAPMAPGAAALPPPSTKAFGFGSPASTTFGFGSPASTFGFGSSASTTFGGGPNSAPFAYNYSSNVNKSGGNPESVEVTFGTGGFKVTVENSRQMNEGSRFAEGEDQVDKGKEKTGPKDFIVDRPFLMMVKFKLDNKYIISFMGNVAKPVI